MSFRVPGHTLKGDGMPYDKDGQRVYGIGPVRGCALCSCGAISETLGTSQRRKWHNDHKLDVIRRGLES